MTDDPATLAKLDELAAAIGGYEDPRRASAEWKQVFRLLQKIAVPGDRVTQVVGMRDVAELTGLIEELRRPAAIAANLPSAEICAKALLAFRKRFELTVLDEESKLGRNPLTKGAKSTIAGIIPPNEWPESVWQELVRQGKLYYLGRGFYKLPKLQ